MTYDSWSRRDKLLTSHTSDSLVDMSAIEAIVLVGGQGTRLRPLTLSAPKPLLPTAGYPFLSHLLTRIKAAGISRVILGTSFKAELFIKQFGDGSDLGLDLVYVHEPEALGTGGAIRNALSELTSDNIVIFNGDVLSGANIREVVNTHISTNADVTLHLVRTREPRAFGCVPTDSNGKVLNFLEKTQDPPTDQINGGCYVFKREIIEKIPSHHAVSLEREVFPELLLQGRLLQGHIDNSYWRDMGTPQDFVAGSADLVRGIAPSGILTEYSEALIHTSAAVNPSAVVIGGSVIGRGVEVGAGVRLDGTIIFDGAVVESGATIERSIIGFGTHIGPRAVISDAVIGDGAHIGARCELRDGARVWPGVVIPDGGLRFSADV